MLLLALMTMIGALTPRPLSTETPQPDHWNRLADRQFIVSAPRGSGIARYFGNASLEGDPSAQRAVIIVHGVLRDADYYFDTGMRVIANAGARDTFLIAPQFLGPSDLKGPELRAQTLRWSDDWPGGADAIAPAPISTYDVFDAMIVRLSDRARFPRLREIVLIGHSAGGQIVQRYAAAGKAPKTNGRRRVPVHFIVSNPSSYFYFDDTRPAPQKNCPDFNHWRYGLKGAPRYVEGSTAASLETQYVARHVTYLLGTADTNPNESDLDRSCGGESQGVNRFERGKNYIAYIKARHPGGTAQDYAFVRGVGHDNRHMFTSACGIAVIFGRSEASCAAHGAITSQSASSTLKAARRAHCATPYKDGTMTYGVAPEYPKNLRNKGSAIVMVRFTISPRGSVQNPKVLQSSGNHEIDNAAIVAVEKSRFSPKIVDCKPVPSTYSFRADFDLGQ